MSTAVRRRILATMPVAILAVAFGLVLAVPAAREFFDRENLRGLLERAGWWGPLTFVVIVAVSVVVSPLPNVPVAVVLGMAYGPLPGTAVTVTGAVIGAAAAFGIARHFSERVMRTLARRPIRFCAGCSRKTLSLIVLLARLIPIVSFDVVSYGAGMSTMRFAPFLLWSFIGMIPWTWFYTTFGSAVLDKPILATVLGVVLAAAVLGLPAIVRRYNPFGLARVMMSDEER